MIDKTKRLWRHTHGDTIVEVMVTLAVLGGGLGYSYTVANRSMLQSRDAQEHTEAMNILQSQVEQLRAVAATPGNQLSTTTGNFCVDDSGHIHAGINPVDRSTFPVACHQGQGYQYYYYLKVGANNTYTATCFWDSVLTNTPNSINLVYRMYEP